MAHRGEVFSVKKTVGKRTYFFNVKENRHGDLFLNVVESKKQDNETFERHSIVIFEEDMEDFLEGFQKGVDYIKENRSEDY